MLQLNSHRGAKLHKGRVQHSGSTTTSSNETAPKAHVKYQEGGKVPRFASAAAGSIPVSLTRAARSPVLAGSPLLAQPPSPQGTSASSHNQSLPSRKMDEISLVGSATSQQQLEASDSRVLAADWPVSRIGLVLVVLVFACGVVLAVLLINLEASQNSCGGRLESSSSDSPVSREIGTSTSFNWERMPSDSSSQFSYQSSPIPPWERRALEHNQKSRTTFLGIGAPCC